MDVHVLAVEGDMFSRAELFDEADLDTAIARYSISSANRRGSWTTQPTK